MSERSLSTLARLADAPEVGRWLSALQDGRLDTLAGLSDLADDVLDRRPPACDNSIGTVLYHVALIEAGWLFDDIFGIDLAESELAEQSSNECASCRWNSFTPRSLASLTTFHRHGSSTTCFNMSQNIARRSAGSSGWSARPGFSCHNERLVSVRRRGVAPTGPRCGS